MNRRLTSLTGRAVCVFLVLNFLFTGFASAQQIIGRQKVDQYATTPWNTSTYGLTWLPTDYADNPSKKYPLILFLHGSGEGGDGVGGLYNLASQGLPMTIANGWNPEAVNPVDGQNYKFIVVSPQAPWSMHWSYGFSVIQYVIADVMTRYRVDPSRVYVTGLSAGGSGTYSCVTNGLAFAQKFAAAVPVCPAGTNSPSEYDQLPLIGGTYGVKVWSPCGATDALSSWAQQTVSIINNANPGPAVPAIYSGIPGVGHEPAGWNTAYNPNWRSNSQNLNIYEWMLKYTRNGNGNDNGNGGKNNLPPVANAGTDQSITLPVSSVQMNGSGTDPDGYITSYKWTQLSGPSNASFSNLNIANPVVSNLAAGTYTFRLTVTDNNGNNGNGNGGGNPAINGATDSDDITITVNPPINFVPVPGRIQAENYSSMSGIQTENTSDAGGGQNVGWQDNNDWMEYAVSVTSSGMYKVNFRVASQYSGNQFQLRKADGTSIATVTIPNTGNFQSWQTVSANVNLNAGQQSLKIYTTNSNGGWNLNWLEFNQPPPNQIPVVSAGNAQTITLPVNSVSVSGSATDNDGWIASYLWSQVSGPSTANISNGTSASATFASLVEGTYTFRFKATDNTGASASTDVNITVNAIPPPVVNGVAIPGRIEAESFSGMQGIQTEYTWDAGWAQNVGWQENNDWEDYAVNVTTAGNYKVNFRVATPNTGVQFQLRKSDGSVLTTVTVPNTGWWHTWQTVTATVNLSAGSQTIRVYTTDAKGTGWNFNWMEFVPLSTPSVFNSHIEAEQYSGMNGIQTENTSDAGGGLNVGWQDNNDWMDYSLNTPSAGTYNVNFRVASMFTGATFQMRKQDGTVLATMTVPNTGNFQSWQTISASVSLPAGQQTFRIVTTNANGGWNINWMDVSNGLVTSGKIEAENYTGMNGIQTENTADAGGGLNVGWQDNNDWMDYNVTAASAGSYKVNFRVASMFTGATFQLRKQDGSVLATVTVPNTGNFQNWQTVSADVSLPAGVQTLRIVTTQANGGWNINWFEIIQGIEERNIRTTATAETKIETAKENIEIFPNPAKDRVLLSVTNQLHGNMTVQMFSIAGSLEKQVIVMKPSEGLTQIPLNIAGLPSGTYILKASMGKWNQTRKIIKQ